MRPMLPGMAAVYGLTWDDIARMPRGEREQYVKELEEWAKVIAGGYVSG